MNSLGIHKNPADTRVVVAMSGGVDSSVVAAMLKDEGYDVVGITLQLYDYGATVGKPGTCCAGQDIHDAKRVAETMGIPHYVLNYENRFKQQVMDDFVDTYLAGETPIPCIKCNQSVKFKDLFGMAKDLNADALATGHYVQRKEEEGRAHMYRAADPARDQSYFLFATTREQIDFLRFPLGHLKSKQETRQLAARFGLEVADKPDSQDICFVPSGDYARVIDRLRPGALEAGDIVDMENNILGRHEGIINYTVGQRKGLGIGGGDPLYVIRLDAEKKQVVVGPKEALLKKSFIIRHCNWLEPSLRGAVGDEAIQLKRHGRDIDAFVPQTRDAGLLRYARNDVIVKLRSMHKGVPAAVEMLDGNRARVTLAEPEGAISPGQACVAYDGEKMLGGGWITAN